MVGITDNYSQIKLNYAQQLSRKTEIYEITDISLQDYIFLGLSPDFCSAAAIFIWPACPD